MSFHSSNGTRGARQPKASRILRWMNVFAVRRIRKGGKFIGGTDALILTMVGRKTGELRSTPVNYLTDENHGWLIAASAAGAAKNPAWYHNIAAHPDEVSIEFSERRIDFAATQLSGEERARAWRRITEVGLFAKYERKTDREIPVIRLTPR